MRNTSRDNGLGGYVILVCKNIRLTSIMFFSATNELRVLKVYIMYVLKYRKYFLFRFTIQNGVVALGQSRVLFQTLAIYYSCHSHPINLRILPVDF